MEPDPDATAAREVLAGNTAAFEGIVRRWQRPLIALAFRYCRDRAVAEEMSQDAFLKVFRRLDRFDGSSAFSTWMFAVALNVFRSHMRRRGLPLIALEDAGERPDPRQGTQAVEVADRDEAVRRAVLHLPVRYREAMLLYYFRDMDLAETASILAVPEGTVKARLHRGRELLRHRFHELFSPRSISEEA